MEGLPKGVEAALQYFLAKEVRGLAELRPQRLDRVKLVVGLVP